MLKVLDMLNSKLEELQSDDAYLMGKLAYSFDQNQIMLDYNLGENIEKLIILKAKIQLLEELIYQIED